MAQQPVMRLVVLLVVVLAIVHGAKIFVKPNGSDVVGCGSASETSCQSLFFAINISAPGDTIYLAPGSYPSYSKFAIIEHDLDIFPSVPEEGPPIINYEFKCISTPFSLGISNTTAPITVRFDQITFANLNCQASSGSALPSIINVESASKLGIPSVQLLFKDVTFEMNTLTLTSSAKVAASKTLKTQDDIASLSLEPGLVELSVPAGNDPISAKFERSLFSGNQAIGLSTFGEMDLYFFDTPVYNTSFYNFPAYYLIEPRLVNISTSGFSGNLIKDNPLSSFLFVNGSSTNTEVIIDNCYFKDGYSPAIRFQGQLSLSVNNTSFYQLTNVLNGGSEFFPPYVGTSTAISYNEYETTVPPTGNVHIANSVFQNTGSSEQNKTDGATVALAGFKTAHILNCEFVDNGVIALALVFSGLSGELNIENSYFSNNTGRAIVFSDITGTQFRSHINNCTFNSNGAGDPVLRTAVYYGGFPGSTGNVESELLNSIITGSSIGLYAGTNELVKATNVEFDVTTMVECDSATVTLVSCTGKEAFTCRNCAVSFNNSPVADCTAN